MKKILLAVTATLALVIVGIYAALAFGIRYAVRKVSTASPLIPTTSSHVLKDVTYCRPEGGAQKLDLYLPDTGNTAVPLIVYVHGGSWVSGSKDEEALARYLPALADTGYAVAAINYRLAPAFTFPAQVQDVKCAIRFLRAHGGQYNLDPGRIGIIGESAGGYLAAFSGTTGDNRQFKTGEYAAQSDRVQAVVDISGPSDFTAAGASISSVQAARSFLGGALPAAASVTTYITGDTPPFLILHGQDDPVVPPSQSQVLQAKLSAAGVPAQLILVQHAGHSLNAAAVQPPMTQLAADILAFLRQRLSA